MRRICNSHDCEGEISNKYQGLPAHSEYQQGQTGLRKVKAELYHYSETSLISVSYLMAKDLSFTCAAMSHQSYGRAPGCCRLVPHSTNIRSQQQVLLYQAFLPPPLGSCDVCKQNQGT